MSDRTGERVASRSASGEVSGAAPFRYDAFISYRHEEPDRTWAQWLHRALETYRVPRRLVREAGLPPRLSRVFRDEEELSASSSLSREIDQALCESRFLIVICSPRTPASQWVNQEVERFRELGRHDRILALLIEGEPATSFPRALCEIRRTVTDASGMTREQIEAVEPLAADVRQAGPRQGASHLAGVAHLRILAQLLGVRYDDLRQRDQQRRRQRARMLAISSLAAVLLLGALAAFALNMRRQAQRLSEAGAADQALQAQLDDGWTPQRLPETEAAVARLAALAPQRESEARRRVAERLEQYVEARLATRLDEDALQGLADDVAQLQRLEPSRGDGLARRIEARRKAWETVLDVSAPSFTEAAKTFAAGTVEVDGTSLRPARVPDTKDSVIVATTFACAGPTRVEAVFEGALPESAPAGVRLGQRDGDAYEFLVRVQGSGASTRPTATQRVLLEVRRNGDVLRQVHLEVPADATTLSLRAQRDGGQLSAQVNAAPPLRFQDAFPLRTDAAADRVSIVWPPGVAVIRLQAARRHGGDSAASPLERADDLYNQRQFAAAHDLYRQEELRPRPAGQDAAEIVQEARYKRAVCLVEMGRADEAAAIWEVLTPEEGDVWPLVAACRLWLTRVEQGRAADGDAVLDILDARGASQRLASLIPRDMSQRITNRINPGIRGITTHDPSREQQLRRLHRAYGLLGLPVTVRATSASSLGRELALNGKPEEALRMLLPIVEPIDAEARHGGHVAFVNYCWMENLCGRPERTLQLVDRYLAARGSEIGGTGMALLLERCYAHARLGDWRACDLDLDAFFAEYNKLNEQQRRALFLQEYAQGCAARGFLREREGDRAAAEREWSKGVYERWTRAATSGAPPPMDQGTPGFLFVMRSMLAALAGELSDEEAQRIIADTLAVASKNSPLQLGGAGAVPLRPAILREMWRTPRGREVARRFAFRDLDVSEYHRFPLVLTVYELVRQGGLPPNPSPEQDQLVWDTAEHGYREFYFNRLPTPQMLQLALAWKGVGGPLGWDGVAPRLEPQLRAKVAYLLALRKQRLGKPAEEVAALFRTAADHAGDDARLRALAQAAAKPDQSLAN